MNHEQQLKIQSYVDSELSDREARKIGEWIAQDSAARALCAELQCMKTAMAGNELEIKVPESREFYWSKIARQIEREERQVAAVPAMERPSLLGWLQRLLVPAAGVAVVAGMAVIAVNNGGIKTGGSQFSEIESHEMGAYTFRSQSEQMTVVWVYDRAASEVANDASSVNPYE
jgi:anti-sigma factor RsiW